MNCEECGIEFTGRKGARFCSPKCRVTFSRKQSIVTDNVTFSEPDVTDNFEFSTVTKSNGLGRKEDERSGMRKAKYWYDVPLAAIPRMKEGWPEMPEWMNGRQYFLWWKNEFRVNEDKSKGEVGMPIIHNPYPDTTGVVYAKAGEGSRHWGTV